MASWARDSAAGDFTEYRDPVLTFKAVDHEGAFGQAKVTVQVGPFDWVDLAFRPQDLNVYAPNVDPWLGGGSPVLVPGGEHKLRLNFQGTGVPLVVTLALYITPPGGVETFLTRETVNVGSSKRFRYGYLILRLSKAITAFEPLSRGPTWPIRTSRTIPEPGNCPPISRNLKATGSICR